MPRLRTNGKYSRIQKCECGTKVKPSMIIGNEPDDWCWPECIQCGDIVCEDCKCEHKDEIYCSICYQGISMARK